ncbi:hypothetical protein [Luteolibacter marinus]|uniref:hypothetical protein n=1 Tax=Luteolibacter marinus TaxID=2776705 RepID=UPI0018690B61|nr:hypothetical protein [Luteolibacter marinus]
MNSSGNTMDRGQQRVGRRPSASRGFALIITLSLMVLLLVLVTALLGISSISLRTSTRNEPAARARANARLALALAIGDLQKLAGADTRVTARADILDENNAPVLGVWKSWEGDDHNSQGRPVSPGNYRSAKSRRFLKWMVSGLPDSLPDTTARKGSVALVGPQSVGAGRDDLQVHLEPLEISDREGDGAMAWWIGGENQKARLPKPFEPTDDSAARWAVVAKSHSVADPSALRLDDLLDEPSDADKVVSLGGTKFVADAGNLEASQEFFHDLSPNSVGLLTNTATGGWRKDLSLATENWNSLPRTNLPFFRLSPEKDIMFAKPTSSSPTMTRSMIYPWASYRGGSSDMPIYRHGPVSSWENLVDYATAYQRVTSSSSGRSRINTQSIAIDNTGAAFNFLHRVRILPVVARMQWVFSHSAAAVGSGKYRPRLLLTPVVTMWNPYSVEITGPPLTFELPKPLPAALRYTVGGTTTSTYRCLTQGSINNTPAMADADRLNYEIRSPFLLKPGETRVFSPQANVVVAAGNSLLLQPGYRSTGGHYFDIKDNSGNLMQVSGNIKADAKFDTAYVDINQGVGIFLDMGINGARHLVYRMIYTPSMANVIYPPLSQLAEVPLSSVTNNPAPFLSTVFGARMASKTHTPAKGFVQSSPLVNYTAMGTKDLAETTIARHYTGTSHPVNSPFDYSFIKHAPGGDSQLPNASDTSGRGYIVTGFNKADGLSRCVIAEIPTRPLLSLAELQNWDLRYENPIPPYAFNLIGNSDATPLLPSSAVVNSSEANLATNLQYDDSYCANHILFDDWFFSSIAPDPNAFGSSGKDLEDTYTDFVTGAEPLGNRAYRAISADTGVAASSAGGAKELYNEHVRPRDAWQTIASRLEVEGMFNVNSTSVAAWRALLGHARNQRVPYIEESGTGWKVELSGESDHPFSRFSVAGDTEAGSAGSSGDFPEATEFAGYRLLDDDVIDELAEEIVNQVRARGPFLSLSEFVNRQLSTGDLALAGTIQSALNKLAESGSSNPYSTIEELSSNALAVPLRAADAEYQFPDAAAGESAYGMPGWIRQADVLRPIAPVLSARDDTFIIRANGDARDDKGNVISTVTCEAVVRRTRDYVDPTEAADLTTPPKSELNKTFGRRFEVVSFRWLNPSEI